MKLRGMRVGLNGAFVSMPGDYPAIDYPLPSPPSAPSYSGDRRATYEQAMAQFFAERLYTPDGGNQLAAPGQLVGFPSNAFLKSGELRVIEPPWAYIPAGGSSYTKDHIENQAPASVILPAIGAQVVVVQFTVPQRRNGVIAFVANEFLGGDTWIGTGALVWQILADGQPIQNYESIVSPYGTTAAPGALGRGPILISEGQLIQLVLNNVSIAPGGQVLVGLLRGWFYSIEAEPAGGAWMN